MYANRLSTKEADNVALKTAIKNLQGEVKNLKAEVATFKRSGHPGGIITTKYKRALPDPKWKREGKHHHPNWWSTPYCWIHGEGGRSGTEGKSNNPFHKSKETATTRSGGINFGLPQGL